MADKTNVTQLIGRAKEPAKKSKTPGGNGGGSGSSQTIIRFGHYCIKNGAFHLLKPSVRVPDADPREHQICDFSMWIIKEIVIITGTNRKSKLLLEGLTDKNKKLSPKEVQTDLFYASKINYNDIWGTLLEVYPGTMTAQNVKSAIHQYSTFLSGDIPQEV